MDSSAYPSLWHLC